MLKTVEIFETKVGQASPDALNETGGIWSLREDGLEEASERLKPWEKWHETLFTSLVLLGGKVLPRFLKVLLFQPLMCHIPGVVLKTRRMPYARKLSAKTTLELLMGQCFSAPVTAESNLLGYLLCKHPTPFM